MGACYSKNTAAGSSSEITRPKHKQRDSPRAGNGNAGITKQKDKHLTKPAVVNDTSNDAESNLSILDAVNEHVNETLVNSGVVPSDSGIESIDTVVDDAGDSVHLKQTDEFYNTVEHPNSGSSLRSGGHDLSLGSRQDERHVIDHNDAQSSKDPTTACSKIHTDHDRLSAKNGTVTIINALTNDSHGSIHDFLLKQNVQLADSSNKDGGISTASESTAKGSHVIQDSVPSMKGYDNQQSNVLSETTMRYRAPLAAFDSVEGNLNESSIHLNGKRQSLLSEILDLTESLCKCDFYSSENCFRDHGVNGTATGFRLSRRGSEIGASGQFEKIDEHLNQIDRSASPKCNPHNGSSSTSTSQMSSTPTRKLASLAKNVSFAAHEDISTVAASGASFNSRLDSMLSSDKYSQRTASEIIFPNKQKDLHKRSASLGSMKATMSDSSSDVPDGTTEDDIASLDLDNISRVTSISYNSIRQLVESTENLVSDLYIARSLTIEGVDCVAIPKDVYRQMQTDLATLKQQLLFLSSVMQEMSLLSHLGVGWISWLDVTVVPLGVGWISWLDVTVVPPGCGLDQLTGCNGKL
ncbi:unnamed protein product [Candidula unifasciata]|uniref:Uncharacterized protein n=1 Tax=Candidula unifasciata TaxID=100452 RepID=A0A8S3ZCK4_9EUPU|nr:unnamed protein product [Candidula unifasciata]